MEYEEKTEEQQGQDNYHERQNKRGKGFLGDFMNKQKEKGKQKILKKPSTVKKIKIGAIAILGAIFLIVFFTSSLYIVKPWRSK